MNLTSKKIDELADNLSESEKKVLLSQIHENLTSNPIVNSNVSQSKIEKDNKDSLEKGLKKEIDSLGVIQRLILSIRGFVLGKDIKEIYNNDLLMNLERRITYTAPTLVSVKKRRFTGILINDFLRIYSLATPFMASFTEIWESPIVLERLIGAIIAEKYNSIKSELNDFLTDGEIDRIIMQGEGLEAVKKRLLRSIYDYRKKIPDFIFPEAEEELMSLIAFKNIVLYNYVPMFKLMGITASDSYEFMSNKTVSMSLVVKYLEEFYKLLIHFSGVTLRKSSMKALINLASSGEKGEDELLWDNYTKLSEKLKSIIINYPFEDLIKFSRSNPYYKIDFSLSRINVAEFYFNALKKEMLSQLTDLFSEREKDVVKQLLDNLFKNFDVVSLQNYKEHKEFDYKRLHLNYFKYIDTLTILLNFLKHYYLRDYKDITFVLSKHIFEKNHLMQNRSLEISIGVDTLLERIIKFDKSLSADSDVGKTMRTLFSSVVGNRQNIRMYKAFVKQKDEEVLELLKLGVKLLTDLEKILNQTVKNPSDTVQLQVSAIHPSISRKSTFKDVIIEKSIDLKKFLEIFNKKINFDSGAE